MTDENFGQAEIDEYSDWRTRYQETILENNQEIEMEITKSKHIGDGVYVKFDGFHVVLWTEGNVIYLEDNVADQLVKFLGDVVTATNEAYSVPSLASSV